MQRNGKSRELVSVSRCSQYLCSFRCWFSWMQERTRRATNAVDHTGGRRAESHAPRVHYKLLELFLVCLFLILGFLAVYKQNSLDQNIGKKIKLSMHMNSRGTLVGCVDAASSQLSIFQLHCSKSVTLGLYDYFDVSACKTSHVSKSLRISLNFIVRNKTFFPITT